MGKKNIDKELNRLVDKEVKDLSETIVAKAVKGGKRYLCQYQDYKEIGTINDFHVFEEPKGSIVFVKVDVVTKFTKEPIDHLALQTEFDRALPLFFDNYRELFDVAVRCDRLEILVIATDRAIIKHHVNAIND